jgi:hypothetical protein
MSYESAPATKMLATQCACCGRALVDAASIEAGMGPTCRKQHGYAAAQVAPAKEPHGRPEPFAFDPLAVADLLTQVRTVWPEAQALIWDRWY